jgi:hypothetical protein
VAAREKPGPPMTLGNMRQNGVRAVIAMCESCGHKADVNVDALPETIFVLKQAGASDAATAGANGSIRNPRGIRDDRIRSKIRKKSPARAGARMRGRKGALRLGGKKVSAPLTVNTIGALLFRTWGPRMITSL